MLCACFSGSKRCISHIYRGDLCSTKGSQKYSHSMEWSVPSGFSCKCHPDYFVSLAPNRLSSMLKVPGGTVRFGGWTVVWVREL